MICLQNFNSPSLQKVTGTKSFLDLEHFRKRRKLSRRAYAAASSGVKALPPRHPQLSTALYLHATETPTSTNYLTASE